VTKKTDPGFDVGIVDFARIDRNNVRSLFPFNSISNRIIKKNADEDTNTIQGVEGAASPRDASLLAGALFSV